MLRFTIPSSPENTWDGEALHPAVSRQRFIAPVPVSGSSVGASVSIALRNIMLFVGATAMMVITSPKLSGFVLLAIPVIVIPLVAFG